MHQDYGIVAIFLFFTLLFPIVALIITSPFRPNRPYAAKASTYECGLDTWGPTWVRFRASYFMYALVFVIFDVEMVFLYPWALVIRSLGVFAFIEMFIFLTILIFAFWYAWKEGALEWK